MQASNSVQCSVYLRRSVLPMNTSRAPNLGLLPSAADVEHGAALEEHVHILRFDLRRLRTFVSKREVLPWTSALAICYDLLGVIMSSCWL